jgi:hypothetical protein
VRGSGDGVRGVELIEGDGQIGEHQLLEFLGSGEACLERQAALPDARLEVGEAGGGFLALGGGLGAEIAGGLRVAELEEGAARHLWVVEHPVHDLELGDRTGAVLGEPGVTLYELVGDRAWHPAVALPEEAEEEGPARVDLVEADGQDLALGGEVAEGGADEEADGALRWLQDGTSPRRCPRSL